MAVTTEQLRQRVGGALSATAELSYCCENARNILYDNNVETRYENLENWQDEAIAAIKAMRPDVNDNGIGNFVPAITSYIVYRAIAADSDAQNHNSALSRKFYDEFLTEVKNTAFNYSSELLAKCISDAENTIKSMRPELRIVVEPTSSESIIVDGDFGLLHQTEIPERFDAALIELAASRAFAAAGKTGDSTLAFNIAEKLLKES